MLVQLPVWIIAKCYLNVILGKATECVKVKSVHYSKVDKKSLLFSELLTSA